MKTTEMQYFRYVLSQKYSLAGNFARQKGTQKRTLLNR